MIVSENNDPVKVEKGMFVRFGWIKRNSVINNIANGGFAFLFCRFYYSIEVYWCD